MKARRLKERPITDLCRGEPCYIRLPDVCNSDGGANSSPAHLRKIGISGMSFLAPPFMVCPACPNCHDAVDRRRYLDLDREYVQSAHKDAIFDWQKALWDRELICVGVGI